MVIESQAKSSGRYHIEGDVVIIEILSKTDPLTGLSPEYQHHLEIICPFEAQKPPAFTGGFCEQMEDLLFPSNYSPRSLPNCFSISLLHVTTQPPFFEISNFSAVMALNFAFTFPVTRTFSPICLAKRARSRLGTK